jgi:hypothetical protein
MDGRRSLVRELDWACLIEQAEAQSKQTVLSRGASVHGQVFPRAMTSIRGNTIASGQCELNILNEAQRSAAQPEEQPPAK